MPQAQTYYLVDFENVKDAGLACNRSLTVSEHIHVFSTKYNGSVVKTKI